LIIPEFEPHHIFKSKLSNDSFNEIALDIFQFQASENKAFSQYLELIKKDIHSIKHYSEIPFFPVNFFKTHDIITSNVFPEIIFKSSGTTGLNQSKHQVANLKIYEYSFQKCFDLFYGNIIDYCVLALLPSYLEREGSSLIYMVDDLIQKSFHPKSGFFLNDHDKLAETLRSLEAQNQKTLLIGVSFAMLDFVEKHQFKLENTIIMETGGMKGKRKEITRNELHELLSNGFGVDKIHSEYGMTELLSQAYALGDGKFKTPPWMKIVITDPTDPLRVQKTGKSGIINIIDLANIYSCSFIATQDIGKIDDHGVFEVLGRFDYSDIRGCNLLIH